MTIEAGLPTCSTSSAIAVPCGVSCARCGVHYEATVRPRADRHARCEFCGAVADAVELGPPVTRRGARGHRFRRAAPPPR